MACYTTCCGYLSQMDTHIMQNGGGCTSRPYFSEPSRLQLFDSKGVATCRHFKYFFCRLLSDGLQFCASRNSLTVETPAARLLRRNRQNPFGVGRNRNLPHRFCAGHRPCGSNCSVVGLINKLQAAKP